MSEIGSMKIGIIGGGPGGYVAAIRAAQLGAEVTLFEKHALGGVCLNEGCIPTKALLHTSHLFNESKNAAQSGVMIPPDQIRLDMVKVQEHKQRIVKKLTDGVSALLKSGKVAVLRGTASFLAKDTLQLRPEDGGAAQTFRFDKIVVASGSKPFIPNMPGLEEGFKTGFCLDSTGLLELTALPEKLLIVGGGVIGIEMASLFRDLGSKVVVVVGNDEILGTMDHETSKNLRISLARRGVEILLKNHMDGLSMSGGKLVVQVESPAGLKEYETDKMLLAIGRRAHIAELNLEAAGVETERGRIPVNDKQETNVPGIYAIGDCVGQIMVAHVASAQGEVAVENALGHSAAYNGSLVPSTIHTTPEYAGIGLTEEQLKAEGRDYAVGRFPLLANGKALMLNGGQGMVKILADKGNGGLLGVYMVGPRATDLIHEAAICMHGGGTVKDIINTIHAHPTVAEAIHEAALAVEKRAIHIINR
ncbi:MAG: dihydrolipoyl dehydrogenase [Deltaproteobacteria bacterium]|jgi:dihydrolipoamide dehydrogenase|nr:dihydrolipoyl dehydrogenase [Deltaproteobacteria bacterium]